MSPFPLVMQYSHLIHYVYLSDASLLLQIKTDPQVSRGRRPAEAGCYLINLRAALIPMQTFPCDIQGTGFFVLLFVFWFFCEPFAIFQKSRGKACSRCSKAKGAFSNPFQLPACADWQGLCSTPLCILFIFLMWKASLSPPAWEP